MKRHNKYNLNLKEPSTQEELSSFLDIIYFFSKKVLSSTTEMDVFNTIVNEITPKLNLVDCVIYKVDQKKRVLVQVAAYGYKQSADSEIQNRLSLNFGEGFAGMAAEEKRSILVKNVKDDPNYVRDIMDAGSEIEVPIKINDEVYAVISSEHSEVGFYNEFYIKIFEIIASITVGVLIKLKEKDELEQIKLRLEQILEKKSIDLDLAIDTLSFQYSELKHQHDKRAILLQEVHHRVNNNLQIISSILKLYLTEDTQNTKNLSEIHDRVQAMALIHQNVYKSFEMNLVDVDSYIRDLMNHLKSLKVNGDIYISFDQKVNFKHIELNTLVPLGLFITEIINLWLRRVKNAVDTKELHFSLVLGGCNKEHKYELIISDEIDQNLFEDVNFDSDSNIYSILIAALVEQLEGEIKVVFGKKRNSVILCFDGV
ncbi:MAG: histidine kinase dimerization/phosphoacceptor domain -containing protein [Brumimicrobium sp.]|nr:histidine kinase dimerization/phosphoacceptor domain -containing protein [Brumimicrobium sp.]